VVVCCLVALGLVAWLMGTLKPEAKELVEQEFGVGKDRLRLKRLTGFTMVGIAAALVQVLGMWLVAAAIESRTWSGMSGLADFLELRALIDNHLLIAATILGLGTLAAGILRSTINEQKRKDWMLALHVIIFGLGYSFLLALAYAPAYLVTQRVGQKLSMELTGTNNISDFLTLHKSLDELLRLQPGSFALTGAIPIAAPFFIGLISAWLKETPTAATPPPGQSPPG
jgi:vacuolar-type H+-ATPase subunit I/STV1